MDGAEKHLDLAPVTGWREQIDSLAKQLAEVETLQRDDVVSSLWSFTDISSRWGYTEKALSAIRSRHADTFPPAVKTFGNTPVFWAPDVDAYLTAYTAGTGRQRVTGDEE